MGEDRQEESPLDLVWSLWTELGVPGPRRDHRRAILDPERFLMVTPWLARADARLSDLVFGWCVQHGTRLSGSRLTALVRTAHPDVRLAAEVFLAELATAGVPLVRVPPLSAARPRSHRGLPIDAERPALMRLRTRALVGVGGRADLLVALLSAPDAWVSASSLVDDVGMAKRHIARVLAELADGTHRPRTSARERAGVPAGEPWCARRAGGAPGGRCLPALGRRLRVDAARGRARRAASGPPCDTTHRGGAAKGHAARARHRSGFPAARALGGG